MWRAVLRIRIRMFMDLPDPDPYSQRYGSDSGFFYIKQNWLLSLKNDVNVPSKSNKQNVLASWRSLTKTAGSGSVSQRYGSTDLRIRIRSKMSPIRNTDERYYPSCERNSPRKAKADVSGFWGQEGPTLLHCAFTWKTGGVGPPKTGNLL